MGAIAFAMLVLQAANEAAQVSLQCLDEKGQPVAAAEVYLFQRNGGELAKYVQFGPYKSDEQGRVVCEQALVHGELGNYDRWIYARVPGHLVGTARSVKFANRSPINPEGRVRLFRSRSIEGTVTVPSGADPTDVTVRVQNLHVIAGPDSFDFESWPRHGQFPGLDTALTEIFECRPDAEGRVRFDDVPARGRLYLVTAGKGLGQAQWRNEGEAVEGLFRLKLELEGVVSGRVVTPSGEPAAKIQVSARLSSRGRINVPFLSTFSAVTDDDGRFSVTSLPETEFTLSVEDPLRRWAHRPLEAQMVPAGQTSQIELALEQPIVVSGRVLDPDGKPISGASLSALADTETAPGLDHSQSDTEGRYELRLPAGAAQLYFNGLPEGFVYPRPQIVKQLKLEPGQESVTHLDFTLERQPKAEPDSF